MSAANTTPDPDEGIGRRIARKRSARGLTQQDLADRAFVSRSLIQQVETGRKPATPSLVTAVASALHIDPVTLYGQPYRGSTMRKDRVHAAIPDIRKALTYVDLAPTLDTPPRPLAELAKAVTEAKRLQQQARHEQLGARLPALIDELTVHAHDTDSPRVWRLLNQTHSLANSLSRRLGYTDLAQLAMERAARSAERSDDPNLPQLVTLSRALLLLTIGAWDPALTLLDRAADHVEQDRPESVTVFGALHLRAAIVAARSGRETEAWEHHAIADDAARRIGSRVRDEYGVQLTAPNVYIHGVAVAVELTDFDEAVRRDSRLSLPSSLPAERRAHHEIDVSRALVSTGQYDRALRRIQSAEKTAPQMTWYHPMARETVGRLVDHYRALPEPLRAIQEHMSLS
ncbi:helix-turn-helix transcriptional regulator [Actinoallomurus sp. NPDC050550]|uniref:helix-turn-helix domain-containing protein n=1 Tax=Actinoallomurus sp. NPDC050550 TaxID=3154937 RepID=UPI00341197EE